MDDALGMRVVEGGGNLPADFEGEGEWDSRLARRVRPTFELTPPLRERGAGGVVHDHHAVAGGKAEFASRLVVRDCNLADRVQH